jgi:peptidoglycan/xylan/chitin deacetylase (PgdA/CDA1 family)
MLVLADDDRDAAESRDAIVIARLLYQRNQESLDRVAELIGDSGAAADDLVEAMRACQLDGEPCHDGDQLAFRDLVQELPTTPATKATRERLDVIYARYEENLRKIFENMGTRSATVAPELWADYMAYLRSKPRYGRPALLAEFADYRAPGTRGVWREDDWQLVGFSLPPKTVVLTFDDGPGRYTDQVLEILDRYGVKAVFFEVGRNVSHGQKRTQRVLQAGHTVGNHTLTHAYLPRLSPADLENELEKTSTEIKKALGVAPALFRPSYGAFNEDVSRASRRMGMKTILWTADSLDWKDPFPESIAERVLRQIRRDNHGVILFHDIHRRTLAAIPIVIGRLQKEGFVFLKWNGTEFERPADRRTSRVR